MAKFNIGLGGSLLRCKRCNCQFCECPEGFLKEENQKEEKRLIKK